MNYVTEKQSLECASIVLEIVHEVFGDEYKMATQINLHPSWGRRFWDVAQQIKANRGAK